MKQPVINCFGLEIASAGDNCSVGHGVELGLLAVIMQSFLHLGGFKNTRQRWLASRADETREKKTADFIDRSSL